MDLLREFFQAFIPLFVAIDPVGMVPIFLAVTGAMTEVRRRRVSFQAVGVGSLLALGFMLLGEATFRFLGIGNHDFMIAGGLILLVLAVMDLIVPGKAAVPEDDMVGVVPLAMPMIAGPATLTTLLVLRTRHDAGTVVLAVAINFLLLLVAMLLASRIARLVGPAAMRALSKVVMVLLAAIAVNFIRTGVALAIKG